MSVAEQGSQFHLGYKTPRGKEAEGKEAGLGTEVEG